MANCEYAPCTYVLEVKNDIAEVKIKVEKLEDKQNSSSIDIAVVKRDVKMLLAITCFIAVSVGGWVLSQILAVI